jgi:hypothetical protein
MKPSVKSVLCGSGITAALFAAAAGSFALSERITAPVFPQCFYALAVAAVTAIFPGAPLRVLIAEVLTARGDIAFYTFVAQRLIAKPGRCTAPFGRGS